MTVDIEKLKPCPFCGSDPRLDFIGAWCNNDNCAIVGQVFSGGARHWNQRAAPAAGTVEKDAARLDWLDEVNRKTNVHYGTQYGWKFDINHNRAALTDHNWPARTVRQAIDAAIEAHTRIEE